MYVLAISFASQKSAEFFCSANSYLEQQHVFILLISFLGGLIDLSLLDISKYPLTNASAAIADAVGKGALSFNVLTGV